MFDIKHDLSLKIKVIHFVRLKFIDFLSDLKKERTRKVLKKTPPKTHALNINKIKRIRRT